MSVTQTLLQEVQSRTQERLPIILEKLLHRIVNPPVAVPVDGCIKHTVLRNKYRELGCLRTRYHRKDRRYGGVETILNKIYVEYKEARNEYRRAKCTCTDGLADELLSPYAICVMCGEQFVVKNDCRHQIHLDFKRGTPPARQVKKSPYARSSWTSTSHEPMAFDVGGSD